MADKHGSRCPICRENIPAGTESLDLHLLEHSLVEIMRYVVLDTFWLVTQLSMLVFALNEAGLLVPSLDGIRLTINAAFWALNKSGLPW